MFLDMLDSQIEQLTDKAKMVKQSLYCLLSAIASFLFCSVFAGAANLNEWVGLAALGTGTLGICLFLMGLGWAMRELSQSMIPLEEANDHLKVVTAHYLAKEQNGTNFKMAQSA
jgi:protein-S-isoprenylcysteine O-methyltransferase Ste14